LCGKIQPPWPDDFLVFRQQPPKFIVGAGEHDIAMTMPAVKQEVSFLYLLHTCDWDDHHPL
jgi:hypothetical protein